MEKLNQNTKEPNQFIKNIQVSLPLKPVITKKQPKFNGTTNTGIDKNINSLLNKKLDPISAPKKINTNVLTSSLQRKPSARSEKVSINCDESTDAKSVTDKKDDTQTNKKKNNNKKPVKKTINVSKSLSSFNLFDNNNIPDEEGSFELDLNSAIEKQKAEKYKALKTFLSEVKMPDLFGLFAKKNIFNTEQIENLSDYDLKQMKIPEKDRKVMLSYVKELKMRNELSVEGDFGTQCDSKNYYNDPNKDNKEEMPQVDKSMKSSTTNISENPVINPKNFLLEIGNSDVLNLNNLCLFANSGNDMKEDQEMDPELVSTQACWNCFKISNIDKCIIYEERLFCSEKCLNKYKKSSDLKCCYCHKNFLKYNGVISGDKLFCSAKCYRDDKNSIKEVEGAEDNEEDNVDKNIKNGKEINIEAPESENEIDILDI